MTVNKDLTIYYSSLSSPHCISCMCHRWHQSNYNITIETTLSKADTITLLDNLTPGAVGELYSILGSTLYYDKTWSGMNTLKLTPNSNANSRLAAMKNETIVYVKNITTIPLDGDNLLMNVKIEAVRSGGHV